MAVAQLEYMMYKQELNGKLLKGMVFVFLLQFIFIVYSSLGISVIFRKISNNIKKKITVTKPFRPRNFARQNISTKW
jgi:hypothetical protein